MPRKLKRIGVFVCHCGLNIAGTVDVQRVVRDIAPYPGVVHAEARSAWVPGVSPGFLSYLPKRENEQRGKGHPHA